MPELVTAATVRKELERQIAAAGSAAEWARRHGLSHVPVSLVRNGHRAIPESIANSLGFVAETAYRQVSK